MNREIKFRAWDKTNEMMLYPCRYSRGDSYPYLYANGNEGFDNLCQELERSKSDMPDYDNCIVMQFTGLKDKNGMEIYEGDVIRIDPEGDRRTIVWDEKEARFCAEEDGSHDELSPLCWDDYAEVIGNIYENPELLSK